MGVRPLRELQLFQTCRRPYGSPAGPIKNQLNIPSAGGSRVLASSAFGEANEVGLGRLASAGVLFLLTELF